jgi:hypothetical protein
MTRQRGRRYPLVSSTDRAISALQLGPSNTIAPAFPTLLGNDNPMLDENTIPAARRGGSVGLGGLVATPTAVPLARALTRPPRRPDSEVAGTSQPPAPRPSPRSLARRSGSGPMVPPVKAAGRLLAQPGGAPMAPTCSDRPPWASPHGLLARLANSGTDEPHVEPPRLSQDQPASRHGGVDGQSGARLTQVPVAGR